MSVGLAVTDVQRSSADELIGEADAAMYEAKAAGRNRIEVFDPSMRARLTERIEVTNGFRGALDRGEFTLALPTGRSTSTPMDVVGFEALARWDHPILGPVPPSDLRPAGRGDRVHRRRSGRWALLEATAPAGAVVDARSAAPSAWRSTSHAAS